MSQSEPKYALEMQDIFGNLLEKDKYETLKKELILRLLVSQNQRIRQLLEKEKIADGSPSQFLHRMKNLAGTTVSEDFLPVLWSGLLYSYTMTRRKPPYIKVGENRGPDPGIHPADSSD